MISWPLCCCWVLTCIAVTKRLTSCRISSWWLSSWVVCCSSILSEVVQYCDLLWCAYFWCMWQCTTLPGVLKFVIVVFHFDCWRLETAERCTSSLQLFLSLAVVTQSASILPVQSFILSPHRLLGLPLSLVTFRRPSKICVPRFCALLMCPKYCNFRLFTVATSPCLCWSRSTRIHWFYAPSI